MRKVFKTILKLMIPALYILIAHRGSAQQETLTIKKAIDIALTNNRSLRSDSLNIGITDQKNQQLAASYRPQINYTSGAEYNPAIASQMVPGSMVGQNNKDMVPVQFGTRYNFKTGVEVTQTIFRKDLLTQIRAADLQNNIAKTKHNLTKEDLVYQVAGLFYALQANAELIRTTHFDYLNMKDVLSIAKAQFQNGVLKKIDYESLEINVANTESQLNQLQTQYNDQLAYFNYLLGLPANSETIISDNISRELHALTGNGKDLQREDIRLSLQLIEAKQEELKSIRAEKMPAISSFLRYSYQSHFNEPGKAFNSNYLYNSSTIGISATIPIFDGNKRKSRISTAKTELEQLKLNSEYKQQQAEMEWKTASGTLSNNQRQYRITLRNLELAEKVFKSRRALYTEGVTTLMELLDAESELSEARNLHIQALIDVQTSWLDLHKANGTLLTQYFNSI